MISTPPSINRATNDDLITTWYMMMIMIDDPYEVATNFCTVHGLPPDYIKEQIISHVKPMTDPAAYKRRMAAQAKSEEERKLIHVPSWVCYHT